MFYEPVSAPRHSHLFKKTLAPRGNSFNPDWPSGASWVRTLPKANETVIEWYDYWYQQRIRALQAVDELVGAIFEKLAAENLLDNTYVSLWWALASDFALLNILSSSQLCYLYCR
jgi:N-acetylglucosamine-6-sulfatase